MKKIISLVLALTLCVTAVTAFASPTPKLLQIDTSKTESKTEGITILGITKEAEDLATRLTIARESTDNIDKIDMKEPVTFIGKDLEPVEHAETGKPMTPYSIVPFPAYTISESVTGTFGKFIIPITRPVKEFITENMEKICFYFVYEKNENIYIHEVDKEDWFVIETGKDTYGILSLIPLPILKDAQGYPACLDFELLK